VGLHPNVTTWTVFLVIAVGGNEAPLTAKNRDAAEAAFLRYGLIPEVSAILNSFEELTLLSRSIASACLRYLPSPHFPELLDSPWSIPGVVVVRERQNLNLFFDKVLVSVSTTAFCHALRDRIQRRSNEAVHSMAKSSGICITHESPLFDFSCLALPVPQ
jgi:hypothetical protein